MAEKQRRSPPASSAAWTYLPSHFPLEKEGQVKGQKACSNPRWATHCTRCPWECVQVTHLPSASVRSGDREGDKTRRQGPTLLTSLLPA